MLGAWLMYTAEGLTLQSVWDKLPALCGGALASYMTFIIIYRLYFHPLRRFPGPRIAAATHLYEYFFNYQDRFLWHIELLHQRYGPIVRITPDELHIMDASFYDEIYAGGNRVRDKDPRFVSAFSAPHAMISTVGHAQHRIRRGVLGEFFSKKAVVAMEPIINKKIDKLIRRLEEAWRTGAVFNMDDAFTAMTVDIISEHSYGVSCNYLDQADFNRQWRDAVVDTMASRRVIKHFPFLLHLMRVIPTCIMLRLNPGILHILHIEKLVRKLSMQSLSRDHQVKVGEKITVFDALNDPTLPSEQRTPEYLADEGHILLIAGTETTTKALATGLFYLLDDPIILSELRRQLNSALPNLSKLNPPSWNDLQHIPYLTGVVNESLRLSHGPSSRLPRVAPNEALKYKDWIIPQGTPVSQSSYFVHMDPEIFQDPEKFDPCRWIHTQKNTPRLDKYLVAFSKGSRQCIGISMANAEIYLTLAQLANRVDLELYETSVDDVRLCRDRFFGTPVEGSVGVRVLVRGVE